MDFKKGKGKYDFSALPEDEIGNAIFNAWEDIEYEISVYLQRKNESQNPESIQKHLERWSAS